MYTRQPLVLEELQELESAQTAGRVEQRLLQEQQLNQAVMERPARGQWLVDLVVYQRQQLLVAQPMGAQAVELPRSQAQV